MKALVVIPELETLRSYGGAKQALLRRVGGAPLLVRTIRAAIGAGVDSLVTLWPSSVPLRIWLDCQALLLREKINGITLVQSQCFLPRQSSSWAGLWSLLQDRFLWLPWNWITHERALANLMSTAVLPPTWSLPIVIETQALVEGKVRPDISQWPEGIPVTSRQTALVAERLLAPGSGIHVDRFGWLGSWIMRPGRTA